MLTAPYKALFSLYATVGAGPSKINFVKPRSHHIGDARWRLRQSAVRSRSYRTEKRRRAGKKARVEGT